MGRFINADALVTTGQGLLGNNMFVYCLNNPVSNLDPSGNIALIDDLAVLSLVVVIIVPMISLIMMPPPPIVETITSGINRSYDTIVDTIALGANILSAKTKGKERVKDTGLANESDEEVQKKAHDRSLPKSEQRRYQTEEKARGLRNRKKRVELYK